MAIRRDDALASVLTERSAALDIVAAGESRLRLIRSLRRPSYPHVVMLAAGIATAAGVTAALLVPGQSLVFAGGAAMLFLAGAIAGLCWRVAAAKRRAEAADAEKSRLLNALGEDLRKPLRAIARAGAAIDRAGL